MEKKAYLSNIDVLHLDKGLWCNKPTTGDPHSGVWGYACAAIGDNIMFFGGYCGHDDCCHNNISQLNPNTLSWSTLVPDDFQYDGPMRKDYCGMIPLSYEQEKFLFIIGGRGIPNNNNPQPNAEYQKVVRNVVRTNEQHLFNIRTGKLHVANVML